MSFELRELMDARRGENFRLHSEYLNPQLAKVLKTVGMDRFYERGEGCYLYDRSGDRYLDFLSGFGVFALGRSHPAIKKALSDALELDLPNLVQLDCALPARPPRRGARRAGARRAAALFLLQFRGGGDRMRHQVLEVLHQTTTHPARGSFLPRAHERCAVAERRSRVPGRVRAVAPRL